MEDDAPGLHPDDTLLTQRRSRPSRTYADGRMLTYAERCCSWGCTPTRLTHRRSGRSRAPTASSPYTCMYGWMPQASMVPSLLHATEMHSSSSRSGSTGKSTPARLSRSGRRCHWHLASHLACHLDWMRMRMAVCNRTRQAHRLGLYDVPPSCLSV